MLLTRTVWLLSVASSIPDLGLIRRRFRIIGILSRLSVSSLLTLSATHTDSQEEINHAKS